MKINKTLKQNAERNLYLNAEEFGDYLYAVIEEKLYSEDIGEYISYGISVRCEGIEIESISDITDDREKLYEIVERCNEGKLDAIHIRDVIEDIFGEELL